MPGAKGGAVERRCRKEGGAVGQAVRGESGADGKGIDTERYRGSCRIRGLGGERGAVEWCRRRRAVAGAEPASGRADSAATDRVPAEGRTSRYAAERATRRCGRRRTGALAPGHGRADIARPAAQRWRGRRCTDGGGPRAGARRGRASGESRPCTAPGAAGRGTCPACQRAVSTSCQRVLPAPDGSRAERTARAYAHSATDAPAVEAEVEVPSPHEEFSNRVHVDEYAQRRIRVSTGVAFH